MGFPTMGFERLLRAEDAAAIGADRLDLVVLDVRHP